MRNRRRPRAGLVLRSAFGGFRFPPEVIVVAVRWSLRFGLSDRDVEELLIERGVEVDHVTIYRWVQRFTPLLAEAARPPVADARLHGEYDLGDDLGGLWPHHVGAQDLPGVLVDHQLQRPLGWPRIAARALNARSAVGSPRAGRRPWPARRSGPRRQAAAECYRPRQALAADLSGSPERVAAGHGPAYTARLVSQGGPVSSPAA